MLGQALRKEAMPIRQRYLGIKLLAGASETNVIEQTMRID